MTGFTFDEVQTLKIEDFYKDFVVISFDQHNSTVILDMMRGIFEYSLFSSILLSLVHHFICTLFTHITGI